MKKIFYVVVCVILVFSCAHIRASDVEEQDVSSQDVKAWKFSLVNVEFSIYYPNLIIAKNNLDQHLFIEIDFLEKDSIAPLTKFELGKSNSSVQLGSYGKPVQVILLNEGVKFSKIQVTISKYADHLTDKGKRAGKLFGKMIAPNQKQEKPAPTFIAKKIFILE